MADYFELEQMLGLFFNDVSEKPVACHLNKESIGSLVRLRSVRDASFLDSLKVKIFDEQAIQNAVERRTSAILKECCEDEINLSPLVSLLHPYVLGCLKLYVGEEVSPDECSIAAHVMHGDKRHVVVVGITGADGREQRYAAVLNKKCTYRWDGSGWHAWRGGGERVTVFNPQRFFSELIMVSEIYRYYDEELCGKSEDYKRENVVYAKSRSIDIDRFRRRCVVFRGDPLYEDITNYLNQNGIEYKVSDGEGGCLRFDKLSGFCLMDDIRRYPVVINKYRDTQSILSLFMEIVREHNALKQRREYLKGVESDYAMSYEELKNTPEKYREAAKASQFRKVFGEVEYDPDVDLSKMTDLECEFKAVMEVLGVQKLSDYALRFRKLGHHKASGLYYPAMRCVCVDIRTPSSFVHELFHLFDFRGGELSLKAAFYDVRMLYEKLLTDTVDKLPTDSPAKRVMKGTTKYNLSYYLEPTEIFARCGELYCLKFLGIKNTLLQPEKGIAYPDDEELLEQIKAYFDKFFEVGNKEVA